MLMMMYHTVEPLFEVATKNFLQYQERTIFRKIFYIFLLFSIFGQIFETKFF
jgi:hypothetical protein